MRDLVSKEIAELLWWEGETRDVGKSNTSCEGQIATARKERTKLTFRELARR